MALKEKNPFTFVWKIENFSHCLQTTGEKLESPKFTVPSHRDSCWSIRIYPKGNDKDLLNFYLNCDTLTYPNVFIDLQLSLVAADGSIINKDKAMNIDFHSNMMKSVLYDTTQKDVYETKRSVYLPQDTLTVFCRLWETNSGTLQHVQCFARTRLGVERMSKLWTLRNFSMFKVGDKRNTAVSLFEVNYTPIVLNMSWVGEGPEIYLQIKISREKCPGKYLLSCTISVLNNYKRAVKELQGKRMCLSNQELSWTFPKFLSRRELMEGKYHLLHLDALSLKCEFIISTGVQHEKIESTRYELPASLGEDSIETWWENTELSLNRTPSYSETKGYLKSDLLSLYQEKTLSDFELRSEGIAFPVHKTILCARSPVFKAMITSDMQEVATNKLNVPDIDAHTLTRMLLYIYTDSVDDDLKLESASQLYYASDKYEILSLKQKCSSALKSYLTVTNASVILSLADKHRDDELTSAVHDFILNHDKEIMQSTEWLEFEKSNFHLAAKTMYAVYKEKLHIKS